MNKLIAISDIKYDLLKIIEPYDGIITKNNARIVERKFVSYLDDLKKETAIKEFNITFSQKNESIMYDVGVKLSTEKSPKKLKIYVSTFSYPWVNKSK
jgi:hypothetical protein